MTSNLLTTDNDWVKACWSWHLRLIYILPGLLYEIVYIENYFQTIKKAITPRVALEIFISPMLHFAYALGLIYGAVVLIQSHAYVLNCVPCIFIVLIGCCFCHKQYMLELFAIVMCGAGIILLFNDGKAERVDGRTGSIIDYAMCLFVSFLGAIFFMINGRLIKTIPIFTLMSLQSLVIIILMPIILTLVYDDFEYFSFDVKMGGFGFLNQDEFVAGFVGFGLASGFLTQSGSVLCLKLVPPVIITACFLFEIFIGQFLGWFLNIDKLPGMLTWLGTVVVFVGVLLL